MPQRLVAIEVLVDQPHRGFRKGDVLIFRPDADEPFLLQRTLPPETLEGPTAFAWRTLLVEGFNGMAEVLQSYWQVRRAATLDHVVAVSPPASGPRVLPLP